MGLETRHKCQHTPASQVAGLWSQQTAAARGTWVPWQCHLSQGAKGQETHSSNREGERKLDSKFPSWGRKDRWGRAVWEEGKGQHHFEERHTGRDRDRRRGTGGGREHSCCSINRQMNPAPGLLCVEESWQEGGPHITKDTELITCSAKESWRHLMVTETQTH